MKHLGGLRLRLSKDGASEPVFWTRAAMPSDGLQQTSAANRGTEADSWFAAVRPQASSGPLAFLTQLSQRKLCQWMLAYLAFAWLVLQLVGVLSDIWFWSVGLQRIVSVVLGLGILPAGVVAWYHGEQGRQDVSRTELVILAVLAVASVLLILTFAEQAAILDTESV